jgi:GT2 family glycosyltransferase
MNYTVAIPGFEAEETVARVVQAALSLRPPADEIMVVDDSSGDATGERAREAGARVIRHSERLGLAGARNTALAEVRTPFVLWLDSDFVPGAKVASALLDSFDDEAVAGAGGRANEITFGGKADHWRKAHASQDHGKRHKRSAWMIMGLCSMHRVDVLRGVGGFDERFTSCGEDVEMSLRLRRFGYRLVYRPDAVGDHLRHDTEETLLARMEDYVYFTSLALMLHGKRPRRHFAPILLKQMLVHPIIDLLLFRFSLLSLDFEANKARWRALKHARSADIDEF